MEIEGAGGVEQRAELYFNNSCDKTQSFYVIMQTSFEIDAAMKSKCDANGLLTNPRDFTVWGVPVVRAMTAVGNV